MGEVAAIRRIPGRTGIGDCIHTILLHRAENRRDTRQSKKKVAKINIFLAVSKKSSNFVGSTLLGLRFKV